jgi:hypothetical protein
VNATKAEGYVILGATTVRFDVSSVIDIVVPLSDSAIDVLPEYDIGEMTLSFRSLEP